MGELVRWLYCELTSGEKSDASSRFLRLHGCHSPKLSKASVSAGRLWYEQKQLSRYESQQRENIINTSSALERALFCSKVGCEGHVVTKLALNLLWDGALNSHFPKESSDAASTQLAQPCVMPVEYETHTVLKWPRMWGLGFVITDASEQIDVWKFCLWISL